ncbi:DUF2459 domain-containing protein [Acidithiobacillus sp. 'AMD consortium']|uniref:DUF2459 domain-containing protein n=2 Tax=Acidithiobacillus ferrooxidans TaxID=920 RepID=A0A2W1KF85_ACIFR|nr:MULTISPECIES: DUF2459 domain-containing protein [Acidithiobacillus]MDA8115013.1 DUF2459 domain-containing protein [Acidithiobacillus sp.]MBN6743956.1 DUF2459 domain-containing protein [Acidithiobacillus sp. MC2.2]MBU2720731.1 DUF2459 domain-containing protein [Acidithiobacillus ferridurans]MBU2733774.1 DUF2459 domain-containing protein [Acidithiobacillus ferridurans]MBU2808512.1 DUF2459 domain-containing protein [Acidithiobacillus ferrooxidans F221]
MYGRYVIHHRTLERLVLLLGVRSPHLSRQHSVAPREPVPQRCRGIHGPGTLPRLLLAARVAIATLATAMLASCAPGLPPSVATKPVLPPPPHFLTNSTEVTIGVLDEGWHTGLVLPVGALGPSLDHLRHWFPEAKYLAYGWGNRNFYIATHPGPGMAIDALFPSSSVVFVEGLSKHPKNALPPDAHLRWICVSRTAVWRLDAYLGDYLRMGPSEDPVSLAPGPFPGSRFFASTGTYDAFHTCNTWTAAALKFADLPVSDEGVLFAGQVMSEIRPLRSCPE